ncbi:MAG: hypothetical protein AAF798_05560 [Bacteroidota bacterium]
MKTIRLAFSISLLSSLLFSSCVGPVASRYETAHTLGKGKLEIAGGIAQYEPRARSGQTRVDQYQVFGGRIGYGITDQVDAKLRYERLLLPDEFDATVNYLELYSKTRITDDESVVQYSTLQGIDFHFLKDGVEPTRTAVALSLTNMISYQADEIFEAALSMQTRYFLSFDPDLLDLDFENVDLEVYRDLDRILLAAGIDLDLNLGFSTDFDRWALRPFVGMGVGYVSPGEIGIYKVVSWNYGLGFSYTFP